MRALSSSKGSSLKRSQTRFFFFLLPLQAFCQAADPTALLAGSDFQGAVNHRDAPASQELSERRVLGGGCGARGGQPMGPVSWGHQEQGWGCSRRCFPRPCPQQGTNGSTGRPNGGTKRPSWEHSLHGKLFWVVFAHLPFTLYGNVSAGSYGAWLRSSLWAWGARGRAGLDAPHPAAPCVRSARACAHPRGSPPPSHGV